MCCLIFQNPEKWEVRKLCPLVYRWKCVFPDIKFWIPEVLKFAHGRVWYLFLGRWGKKKKSKQDVSEYTGTMQYRIYNINVFVIPYAIPFKPISLLVFVVEESFLQVCEFCLSKQQHKGIVNEWVEVLGEENWILKSFQCNRKCKPVLRTWSVQSSDRDLGSVHEDFRALWVYVVILKEPFFNANSEPLSHPVFKNSFAGGRYFLAWGFELELCYLELIRALQLLLLAVTV